MKKLLSSILLTIFLASACPISHTPFELPKTFAESSSETSTTFFEGIELSEPLPKTFYQNEVYIVRGKFTSSNPKAITAVLEHSNSSKYKSFSGKINNNNFEIPLFFTETGSYILGVVLGNSGNSKAISIKINASLPTANTTLPPPRVNTLNIRYKNDQTVMEINTNLPSLKRFTFTQDDRKVTYYSRQSLTSIPINYSDFKNFKADNFTLQAQSARLNNSSEINLLSNFSSPKTMTFLGIEHTFTDISDGDITTDPPDQILLPTQISFSGDVKTDTEIQAYITKPDGTVETVNLTTKSPTYLSDGDQTLKTGGKFTFSYTPTIRGRYIFEINDSEGLPILNHPIYVGSSIPILPDFFDLNERSLFTGTLDIEQAKQELLSYINIARIRQGLKVVSLSSDLNTLAQDHSADMAKNNFFAHVNEQGESPEDRRIKMGLSTPVSENIAKDTSIKFAHNGLMRSGSHRHNILQPAWSQVGLGIAKKDGYLYITEEFAAPKITVAELPSLKTELITALNKARTSKGYNGLVYSRSIELACKDLNSKMIAGSIELDKSILSKTLDQYDIDGDTMAVGRSYNAWSPILASIINAEPHTLDSRWGSLGIDIQLDKTGNITLLFILNKP